MSTAQKDKLLSSTIGDRFRVDELFSSGGITRTYKGFDTQDNRDVIIRVLHAHKRMDKNAVKRFEIAADAARKMSHSAITPLLYAGVLPEGLPYLVYEFIAGHNLRDEIASAGMLSPDRARDILLQVTSALQHAHECGIVHRNLKPGNILIKDVDTDETVVFVTGFGIARQFGSKTNSSTLMNITQTKKVVGSPTYMSPESFSSPEIDARADIYSLGCVMYEMLTGHVPFSGNSFLTTAAKHSYDSPTPVHELNPGVPMYLEAATAVCMRKKPGDRYQSLLELHEDLHRKECRFGSDALRDPGLKARSGSANKAPLSVPPLRIATIVAAGVVAVAICLSVQEPSNESSGSGDLAFLKARNSTTPLSNIAFGNAMELRALRLLQSNRYSMACEKLILSLNDSRRDSDDELQARIELAFCQYKSGKLSDAESTLEYTKLCADNPLLGQTLLGMAEEYLTVEPEKARYYASTADYLGYHDKHEDPLANHNQHDDSRDIKIFVDSRIRALEPDTRY